MRPRVIAALCALAITIPAVVFVAQYTRGGEGEPDDEGTTSALVRGTAPPTPVRLRAATGVVHGVVRFAGELPEQTRRDQSSDPFCMDQPQPERLRVNDGFVADAVVRVVTAGEAGEPPEIPVVIEQTGCEYRPFIAVAMRGQPIVIKNNDETLHNVHPIVDDETQWNYAQPRRARPLEKIIGRDGTWRLKCDVHPWMLSFLVVATNPYIAQTEPDGAFELTAPAGDHEIHAWHPLLGEITTQVKVPKGGTIVVELTIQ